MQYQIKDVIKGMNVGPARTTIDLSATQNSPLGNLLYILYYKTDICDLLDPDWRFGYPHNGGSHTFRYTAPHKDMLAFLEVLTEEIPRYTWDSATREVALQLTYVSQEILRQLAENKR